MKQLPKSQRDLLAAIESGVKVFYMKYMGRFNPTPYFFRGDTMARCTAAANGLLDKGRVKMKRDTLIVPDNRPNAPDNRAP
jgi:uncharacterized protein YfaP (DUF2135 family)